MGALYRLVDVGVRYDGETALQVPALEFSAGEFVAIIGGNGAGKSTLLRVMARLCDDYTGECYLDGRELRQWDPVEFAARVAYVPQGLSIDIPMTAGEVVLRDSRDTEAAERALTITGTLRLRRRDFRTLSGGEKQRVLLAGALAQSARVMLLDEPVRYLDLARKLEVFRLLREQAAAGMLVVAATHEVNEAVSCATRTVVLEDGVLGADGGSQT